VSLISEERSCYFILTEKRAFFPSLYLAYCGLQYNRLNCLAMIQSSRWRAGLIAIWAAWVGVTGCTWRDCCWAPVG